MVPTPLSPHLLVLLGTEVMHRPEEDRSVIEVVDRRDDHVGRGTPQPLLHRRIGIRERIQPLLLNTQHARVHLMQQVVLGAEVVVQRPLVTPAASTISCTEVRS